MGLKMMQQQHPTGLPPHLLAFFEPREPLPFAAPPKKHKPGLPYTGAFAASHATGPLHTPAFPAALAHAARRAGLTITARRALA